MIIQSQQTLWDDHGFRYWLDKYKDYLYDPTASRASR
jgi:hypothetical protein